MNATKNRFNATFDDEPILDGREYIEADLGGGVTVRAYVEHDPYAEPDADDPHDVEDFNNGTLRYCAMTLNVYIDGACVMRGARSLYQIGIEEGGDNGVYLTECANDLLGEIDLAGIVSDFAKKATAAARQMKKGAGR